LNETAGRIVGLEAAAAAAAAARRSGRSVVFTNGCFDLLHAGHLHCLEEARRAGDLLVVAVNSDESVRRLKGEGRPVLPGQERAELLAGLRAVDLVFLFDEDTPLESIRRVRPDVLVKGGDWRPEDVVGRREVESWNGRVLIVPTRPGDSTSSLVERIRERFGKG
jgi:D-beta-D-heptose 7-phosphate kinase/D-beta-D-heptose 1-phosphate adenosyltransferase